VRLEVRSTLRPPLRPQGADLRDGDLEVREDLQEEGLELLVRPIHLVDEQHGGLPVLGQDGLQQGAADEELVAEDVLLDGLAGAAPVFLQFDAQHLLRVVPLVEGRIGIQPLVTLQADQPRPQGLGRHLGHLRLPHAGLAFQKEGLAHDPGQIQRRGQRPVPHVPAALQRLQHRVNGCEHARLLMKVSGLGAGPSALASTS